MSQHHILVVEDDPDIRALLSLTLSRDGYHIRECTTFDEAARSVARNRPDLAIVDWMLPGGTGLGLLKRWRADDSLRDLPILLLTARSSESDKVQGLDAGADDYLTKPFSPRELLARIKAMLRRRGSYTAGNTLTLGRLRCLPEQQELYIDDMPVALAQTEFRLLCLMLQSPERVFSRNVLMDRVWGPTHVIDERTVDVHILRLRKTLRSHGCDHYIQTVRGVGYKLVKTDD